MESQTLLVGLLALCISWTFTFPLISKDDGAGEVFDNRKSDSNCEEQTYVWEVGVMCENDTGQGRNVNKSATEFEPDESLLEVIDYVMEDLNEKPGEGQQFTVTEDASESLPIGQIVYDKNTMTSDAIEEKSRSNNKYRMKRSSLFDNLQARHEASDDRVQNKTEGGEDKNSNIGTSNRKDSDRDSEAETECNIEIKGSPTLLGSKEETPINNVEDFEPQKSDSNITHKETTPKPWYWSWLFKSSNENTTHTLSAESKETIKHSVDESDHYEKDKNATGKNGCSLSPFEMEDPDNFTIQIHKEKAILEQKIMDQNPGITTTESVWNTDEFIARTSF